MGSSVIGQVVSRLSAGLPAWRELGGMDIAFGGVVDDRASSLQILTTVGARTTALQGLQVRAGAGVGGKSLSLARPTRVVNYRAARGITHQYDEAVGREGLLTVVAVPIIVAGAPRAVVYLGSTTELHLGDRWFDALDPLRRRLGQEILLEDEISASQADPFRTSAELDTRPSLAELGELARELDEVAKLLGTASEVSRRLGRVRERLSETGQPKGADAGVTLTARERQVLENVARGLTTKQVAVQLGLRPNTVKSYLQDLMSKLGCSNRMQAVAHGRRAGWID